LIISFPSLLHLFLFSRLVLSEEPFESLKAVWTHRLLIAPCFALSFFFPPSLPLILVLFYRSHRWQEQTSHRIVRYFYTYRRFLTPSISLPPPLSPFPLPPPPPPFFSKRISERLPPLLGPPLHFSGDFFSPLSSSFLRVYYSTPKAGIIFCVLSLIPFSEALASSASRYVFGPLWPGPGLGGAGMSSYL